MPNSVEAEPGFADEIEADKLAQDKLAQYAQQVHDLWIADEPVRTGRQEAYTAGSLSVDGNKVVTSDPIYHIIEWGSVNNPPYRPAARAVQRAGLRWIPNGGGGG